MVKYRSEKMFAALGQPVRRQILESLARKGSLSLTEASESLHISLPAILKHARVLEDSGLMTCTKEGRTRNCSINSEALDEMLGWLFHQKGFWEGSFKRLEKHLTKHKRK